MGQGDTNINIGVYSSGPETPDSGLDFSWINFQSNTRMPHQDEQSPNGPAESNIPQSESPNSELVNRGSEMDRGLAVQTGNEPKKLTGLPPVTPSPPRGNFSEGQRSPDKSGGSSSPSIYPLSKCITSIQ
ncbi:unnamed protein product [Orchesella dallaii]|uniref:Uncharacterized protein n=1 Tax=Orchesella dallaii TaxID=48710 RepID=A0ABP1R1T5_9HEXA